MRLVFYRVSLVCLLTKKKNIKILKLVIGTHKSLMKRMFQDLEKIQKENELCWNNYLKTLEPESFSKFGMVFIFLNGSRSILLLLQLVCYKTLAF